MMTHSPTLLRYNETLSPGPLASSVFIHCYAARVAKERAAKKRDASDHQIPLTITVILR